MNGNQHVALGIDRLEVRPGVREPPSGHVLKSRKAGAVVSGSGGAATGMPCANRHELQPSRASIRARRELSRARRRELPHAHRFRRSLRGRAAGDERRRGRHRPRASADGGGNPQDAALPSADRARACSTTRSGWMTRGSTSPTTCATHLPQPGDERQLKVSPVASCRSSSIGASRSGRCGWSRDWKAVASPSSRRSTTA